MSLLTDAVDEDESTSIRQPNASLMEHLLLKSTNMSAQFSATTKESYFSASAVKLVKDVSRRQSSVDDANSDLIASESPLCPSKLP